MKKNSVLRWYGVEASSAAFSMDEFISRRNNGPLKHGMGITMNNLVDLFPNGLPLRTHGGELMFKHNLLSKFMMFGNTPTSKDLSIKLSTYFGVKLLDDSKIFYRYFIALVYECYVLASVSCFKHGSNKNRNEVIYHINTKPKYINKTEKKSIDCSEVVGDKFLTTFEWRKLRMEALQKYGSKCMCCGATPEHGAVMNVDHIKPRKKYPHLALDINNLQILCGACNHGKGNWDETDWRPSRLVAPRKSTSFDKSK